MWQLSLLNGAFLWGALAVGVPLALHLMMRRQPRHLEFPALRFIKQRESANRRQLKLRHLVLLALRMAFILLLAAALARPSLQGSGWLGDQEAPVAAALVFDTNPRMEYRNHNETRLESARDTGLWLLPQLPRDSEVAVLDSRYGSEARAFDLLAAKSRIEKLKSSPAGSPLPSIVCNALDLLRESGKPRKEVYIFTDLARANWAHRGDRNLAQPAGRANRNRFVRDRRRRREPAELRHHRPASLERIGFQGRAAGDPGRFGPRRARRRALHRAVHARRGPRPASAAK